MNTATAKVKVEPVTTTPYSREMRLMNSVLDLLCEAYRQSEPKRLATGEEKRFSKRPTNGREGRIGG